MTFNILTDAQPKRHIDQLAKDERADATPTNRCANGLNLYVNCAPVIPPTIDTEHIKAVLAEPEMRAAQRHHIT